MNDFSLELCKSRDNGMLSLRNERKGKNLPTWNSMPIKGFKPWGQNKGVFIQKKLRKIISNTLVSQGMKKQNLGLKGREKSLKIH